MMIIFGLVKFVSYAKKTQQNKLPTYLVQWQKGKMKAGWPKEMATKPAVFPSPKWANPRK
jgi:branched-chain amino acid transport system substrate-binding protein